MRNRISVLLFLLSVAAVCVVPLFVGCNAEDSAKYHLKAKDASQIAVAGEKKDDRGGVGKVMPEGVIGHTEKEKKLMVKEYLNNSEAFIRRGRYEEALAMTEGALRLEPNNGDALTKRSILTDAIRWRRALEVKKKIYENEIKTIMRNGSSMPDSSEIVYPGTNVGGMVDGHRDLYFIKASGSRGLTLRETEAGGQASELAGVIDLRSVDADEIWVISRRAKGEASDGEPAGTGALLAVMGEGKEDVALPLKHTDVSGQIAGYIASVRVKQQFENPYETKIEAVYVFPLPQNAAVNEFIMTIGERKIRGIIRERKEAEKIYQMAKRQGHVASLLTQERPNIFTQKVANIEAGKSIDIDIRYFNTLEYVDGWYEFVFPMVVGPRYNPAGSTDGVGAVAAGKSGSSGQKTEVEYLKPNQRSGHDISLSVDIDAGLKIEEVKSTNHVIEKKFDGGSRVKVAISKNDTIPNKDFVLRYRVAGKTLKSAVVTSRDERGGFFTMMLYPPESLKDVRRAPMEMIFVLDCSGSMSRKPIAAAKKAISIALKKLGPDDSFQIIRFSSNASKLGPHPVIATPENVAKGLAFVESLRGSGGTRMIEGIKAALDFEHDPERFRFVSFMTDGYIGNEKQILAAVAAKLGHSRIFSFGVGSSPNRFLLDRMAKLGRGAVAYVGLNDDCGDIVDAFYERITHPAMTDVKIDFGGMKVFDVYPSRVSDLFVGRPIVITGRFKGKGRSNIAISGVVEGEADVIDIPVDLDDPTSRHEGIASVWARKKIESLATMGMYDKSPKIPDAILDTALEYGLMSAYTAFLAVDSATVTDGEAGVSVAVPVPVPDGVKYETTVN